MIAYNHQSLDNLDIQQQARGAFEQGRITAEEYSRIRAAYPYQFYIPNFFIRVGLFLLTVLASACALGLLVMMDLGNGERGIGGLMIVLALISYGSLELFIHGRKLYQAGVDDALLWIAAVLLYSGIGLCTNRPIPPVELSLIVLLLATIGVVRYGDKLMVLCAYAALLCLVVYSMASWGSTIRQFIPFVVMGISYLGYAVVTDLCESPRLRHYRDCLVLLRVSTMISFYLGGNYFVIREVNASLFGNPGEIPFAGIWWGLTTIIPISFIRQGLRKKDPIFLWTGLGLVAASIFTFRYYYHILPAEWAMIIGGSLLIAGVFFVMRYLRTPKHGFTAGKPDYPSGPTGTPIEGIILAETFTTVAAAPTDKGVQFGGGSTGGGGAGGEY